MNLWVSNCSSSSGGWELNEVPAVGDPPHMVQESAVGTPCLPVKVSGVSPSVDKEPTFLCLTRFFRALLKNWRIELPRECRASQSTATIGFDLPCPSLVF